MSILALDVGSSAVKAALLDRETAQPIYSPVKVHYEIEYPTPDAAEVPAERLKMAVWEAAKKAVSLNAKGEPVEGIGFSCLMPALVLLGDDEKPLSPIWFHLDRRSRPLARKVLAERGDEFLAFSGNRPLPGGISALCYGQQVQQDPNIKKNTRHYLHANAWLAFLLSGEKCFDVANASFSGLFGTLTDQKWSPEWCEYFGVDPAWLPSIVSGNTTLGGLLPSVAVEWGLPAGIPVKIGTADTSSGMLVSEMKAGDLFVTVGTTTVLARFVDQPKPDAHRLTRMFGIGERFIYAAHNPVGGSALAWMQKLCFADLSPKKYYDYAIPEAAKRATTVQLNPPFLGGDRLEIEPRRAAFHELNLSTDRMDLLAALLVSMREGHRAALSALDLNPEDVGRIYLTGGGLDTLRTILPEFATADVETIDEGALRGVARLW